MLEAHWDNLLILQTSFLGDTILTLPLITAARQRFPVRRLSVVCQPLSAELLQEHPAIDEIIIDDKKDKDRGLGGLRRKAATLAAKKFTLALSPHKSLRSALMLYWAGIPLRVGFRQSRGWWFFHLRVRRDSSRHDVERNLSLLDAFGPAAEEKSSGLDLPASPVSQGVVDGKLQALGVNMTKIIVGVNPGSIWPTKRWSPDGFAGLIQILRQRLDCQVLLFGGPDDADVVRQVLDRCEHGAISLVGKISLGELAAAIRRCRVFVTNDSAPMHVAVATGVPTVAVFCATTPDLGFYPYSHNAIVVEKKLSCRPCTSHGGRRCPLGHAACIHQIHPEIVAEAVQRLLRAEGGRVTVPSERFRPEFQTL